MKMRNLALGEGTGAVMLFPLLDMAEAVYRENSTFEDIHVGAYQSFEEQELDECAKGELLYFTEKNVCYLYLPCESKDLRTAWNYESNNRILNISDLLPVTFYVEDRTANRLTLKYYTYSATGQLDIYIKTYKTVETIIEDGKLRLKESHQ